MAGLYRDWTPATPEGTKPTGHLIEPLIRTVPRNAAATSNVLDPPRRTPRWNAALNAVIWIDTARRCWNSAGPKSHLARGCWPWANPLSASLSTRIPDSLLVSTQRALRGRRPDPPAASLYFVRQAICLALWRHALNLRSACDWFRTSRPRPSPALWRPPLGFTTA